MSKQTPQFILELLEKELRRVQSDLLEKVATKYNLDHAELVESFLPKQLKVCPTKDVAITVTKKHTPLAPAPAEVRCMARIWNRGKGGQCTRARREDSEYCTHHMHNRKHGKIEDVLPRQLYPAHSSALYK